MPRLSIIVPHVDGDAALESTLLSLLENRSAGVEILVAHRGNYQDPYDLGRDEIQLIEVPESTEAIEMVNLAVNRARSPYLEMILPGCTVEANWFEPALEWFKDSTIASVSPAAWTINAKRSEHFGLDIHSLPRRNWVSRSHAGKIATATWCGGFFRRDVLLSLEGWLPGFGREIAEAEFGKAIQLLDLTSVSEPESMVFAPKLVIEGTLGGYALGNVAGKLALAYAELEHQKSSASITSKLSHLAGCLLNPASIAERLGWVVGLSDRSLVDTVADRIESALEDAHTSTRRIAA